MTYGKYLKPSVKYAKVGGPTKLAQEVKMTPEMEEVFRKMSADLKANPIPPTEREKQSGGHRGTYTKHVLKTGRFFGHLVLRRKAAPDKGAKPTLRERWHCECLAPSKFNGGEQCGNKIVVPKYYLIRKPNPKTHCGCMFETNKSRHAREYRIYHMMHQRCMNPNHESYEHYKKRGITIYEPWQKHNEDGFDLWLKDVGPCPTPYHSLDRIRNADGYVPGNLKWSTAEEQRLNQGDLIGGKTAEEIEALGMTEDEWVEHTKKHGYF